MDQAIDLLEPAEACTEVEHPNLAAWRQVRADMADRPGAHAVAVFLGDLQEAPTQGRFERLLWSAVSGGGNGACHSISTAVGWWRR